MTKLWTVLIPTSPFLLLAMCAITAPPVSVTSDEEKLVTELESAPAKSILISRWGDEFYFFCGKQDGKYMLASDYELGNCINALRPDPLGVAKHTPIDIIRWWNISKIVTPTDPDYPVLAKYHHLEEHFEK